jgi:hypothetical protein
MRRWVSGRRPHVRADLWLALIDRGGAADRVTADPQDKLVNCENVNGSGKKARKR